MALSCLWLAPQVVDSCRSTHSYNTESVRVKVLQRVGLIREPSKVGAPKRSEAKASLGTDSLSPKLPLCCLGCQGLELQMGSRPFVKLLAEPSPASYRTALQYEAFVEGGRENFSP